VGTLICGSLCGSWRGGELKRIRAEVDPILEIAEVRSALRGGGASGRTALDRRYCSKSRRGRGIPVIMRLEACGGGRWRLKWRIG